MNRVKDYYETAVLYLKLPDMARYVIGTQFHVMNFQDFVLNQDEISDIVFKRAIEKGFYTEFRSLVRNHKSHGTAK